MAANPTTREEWKSRFGKLGPQIQQNIIMTMIKANGTVKTEDILWTGLDDIEKKKHNSMISECIIAQFQKQDSTTGMKKTIIPPTPPSDNKKRAFNEQFDSSSSDSDDAEEVLLDPFELKVYLNNQFGNVKMTNKQVNVILESNLFLETTKKGDKKVHDNIKDFIETISRHYGFNFNSGNMEEHIEDVYESDLVIPKKVMRYLVTLGFSFGMKREDIAEILKCKENREEPIILIFRSSQHMVNKRLEKHVPGKWYQFCLLFQQKNLLVPFNTEEKNIVLGTQLRNERGYKHDNFEEYCLQNLNSKISPIQGRYKSANRKMEFVAAYELIAPNKTE